VREIALIKAMMHNQTLEHLNNSIGKFSNMKTQAQIHSRDTSLWKNVPFSSWKN
jgi:hypothetical protein